MLGSLGGVGAKLGMLPGELGVTGTKLGQRTEIPATMGMTMDMVSW
jgi:hypothetical protein